MKALIIEDNQDVVDAVTLCLQLRWPEVDISSTTEGSKGMNIIQSESFDIVILDLNLPDSDGIHILKEIRSFSKTPIIILTVRGNDDDQAKGLEAGADDYIVKPFRPRDLVARVNAVLRRSHSLIAIDSANTVIADRFVLDLTRNRVLFDENEVELTPTELKVLYILITNAGKPVSSTQIYKAVWGKDCECSNPVRTYIRRLREKLSDKPAQIIISIRGEGYKFASPV
jgi:DNA-binding response OmpR family regulator